MKIQNYIGGEWSDPRNQKFLDVYNPATGQVYAQSPDSDAIDSVYAVQAAQKAFSAWRETTASERAGYLMRIAEALEAKIDFFAECESEDVGKPLWLAREVDLPRTILNFRYFAGLITTGDARLASQLDGGYSEYTRREPLGVNALISPWNLPLYTLTFKIAPSLAMGNTVVCKPSELTPRTAYELTKILQEVGVPPGVCNFVFGRGESAGAALVQHPGVPLISFTGGTETAQKIQQVAGPMMKRLSLELGGKNASVVFNDADLEKSVASIIRASFLNSGQICLCGSRLLIQEGIYPEFMSEFRRQTESLVVGDPKDPKTFMGPLISHAHRERVKVAIAQAQREDGRVTVGGDVPKDVPVSLQAGYFLRPTIIEDLTNCSDLWLDEIFGPVVTTMSFKYPHDAVKWANTSSYGLAASVWTRDLSRAHKVASQIAAGTIWLNTWGVRDVRMPFGGYKMSGIGREGGEDSLRTYSETKTICAAQ